MEKNNHKIYLDYIYKIGFLSNNTNQGIVQTGLGFVSTKLLKEKKDRANQVGGSKHEWINNFMSLYEKIGSNYQSKHIIPDLNSNFSREMAYDDKMKKKKKEYIELNMMIKMI